MLNGHIHTLSRSPSLTLFNAISNHNRKHIHTKKIVKWLRCDVMLMMWIGIWRFFVQCRFQSTFEFFFPVFLFLSCFVPLNSFCITSKKTLYFFLLWCNLRIVQSPPLLFILIIWFVCVYNIFMYINTAHHLHIMYWFLQTFVIIDK